MFDVKLISATPDYIELLKVACSKPYGNKITEKSIQAIIESGHLSVLEHCYASFEIECSVRVLGQLTRHRHLSFTCQSARGKAFDKMIVSDGNSFSEADLEDTDAGIPYLDALEVDGLDYEDAAYLLPQGALTHIVVTGNLRSWYEYLPKRLCERAMPEHKIVARKILKELQKAFPLIFEGKSFMNCDICTERSCRFK